MQRLCRGQRQSGVTKTPEPALQPSDADDFTAFVRARGHALTRTAFLLSGDQALAEDTVQAALARAYVRWSRVRRADSPEAYVRRMVVNQHISSWRARRHHEVAQADVPDSVLADPTQQVATRLVLHQAVRRLPAKQRAAVVLRYYEDLPDAEIADILGCSAATVRSQISRALATIRSHGTLLDQSDDSDHERVHPSLVEGEVS